MVEHIAQVGGTHYEAPDGVQHWDLIEAHDISYLEATATKYIVRYDRKGTPLQDLRKARSYLQRVLQENRGARRRVRKPHKLERFVAANHLDDWKGTLLTLILFEGEQHHIVEAIRQLDITIRGLEQKEAAGGS